MYIIPSDTTWTCTEGAKGRVVGPDIDVEGEIIEIAPTSVRVRWDGGAAWFNTDPGQRYLRRLGDTAERPLRFAPT